MAERRALESAYVSRWEQLVERARQSPDAFCAVALKDAEGAAFDTAPVHRVLNQFVTYCWAHGYYAGILAPWGHGKSMVVTVGRVAWEIGRNTNTRVKVVSGSDNEAMDRVQLIRGVLVSPTYRAIFPHVAPAQGFQWTMHALYVERTGTDPNPTVEALSVWADVGGVRGDILVLDDVATENNMLVERALRPMVYNRLSRVWLRRIVPTTRVVYLGTAWAKDDPAHRLMSPRQLAAQGGRWRWLVVGVHDDFTHLTCQIL